ncbi:hypothetical protein [Luteitalea pratensis]|nr:hypothetical protein [Luteitalea pratensis]
MRLVLGPCSVGLVVHSSADPTNDFTISGITSADLVGTLNFDSARDFVPNGTLAMELADCSAVAVP